MDKKEPNTLKHRLLTGIGFHYVPERRLMVKFKDGSFDKFLDHGYHWCSRWNEEFRNTVVTSLRICELDLRGVRSADKIPHQIKGELLFKFDPRQAASAELGSKLAQAPAEALTKIIRSEADNVIRLILGQQTAETLANGTVLGRLQREIKNVLFHKIGPLGFELVTTTPVRLKEIKAPKHLEAAHQRVSGWGVSNEYLNQLSPEMTTRMLFAEFLSQLQQSGGSINLLASELSMLLNQNSGWNQPNGRQRDSIIFDYSQRPLAGD